MCGPIVGIILSVAGAFAQAAVSSSMAKQQAAIEQNQIRVEMENERIKAIGDTTDRMEQFRRENASNLAALSASGLDENVSYTQGMLPYATRVVGTDVGRTIFNSDQVVGRKKYEIAVSGWKAKAARTSAFASAGAQALGQVGSYFTRGE